LGDLEVYGADAKVVATRAEIERVRRELEEVARWLEGQVQFDDFLSDPLARVGLAMEVPLFRERISSVRLALVQAAESYFSAEARATIQFEQHFPLDVPALAALAARIGSASLSPVPPGPFAEKPVFAAEVGESRFSLPPNSLVSMARRLQETANLDNPTIRIERFGKNVVVFVPGTRVWSPSAGKDPLDVTSNLRAMAGPDSAAGSQRALSQALRAANVGRGDRVVFVGHSQGGMIAANLATKPQPYRVAGLVTFGAPLAQLEGKLKVPILAVEHNGDLVPKLAMKVNPIAENWATVASDAPNHESLASKHSLSGYRQTAFKIDQSSNLGLKRIREFLTGFAGEDVGEVRWFEIARAGAKP
jgi:pimeloyl-ACP methyl ester carboxylesterase